MWSMTDSMAQAARARVPLDVPRWRNVLGWAAAVSLALLFLFSGLWKITDAQGAAVRMAQARVPESISLAAALGFGIVETVAAVLLLVPRLRRWGAWATGLLLLAFLVWFADPLHRAARHRLQLLPVAQARGRPRLSSSAMASCSRSRSPPESSLRPRKACAISRDRRRRHRLRLRLLRRERGPPDRNPRPRYDPRRRPPLQSPAGRVLLFFFDPDACTASTPPRKCRTSTGARPDRRSPHHSPPIRSPVHRPIPASPCPSPPTTKNSNRSSPTPPSPPPSPWKTAAKSDAGEI